MLDIEGAARPADVAIIGTEESIESQLRRLIDAGATDFGAVTYGSEAEQTRTRAYLADLAPEL